MERKLDELLRHALAPAEAPAEECNRRILERIRGQENRHIRKGRFPGAVLAASLLFAISSLTVFAAWRYLSAEDVAQEMQDDRLMEAFSGSDAVLVNETQSYGGYEVSLLGLVSGKALSDQPRFSGKSVLADRSYAVVAIRNEDGTPMPDTWDEGYGELEFFVSPLIGGYNPAFYNAASMHGNYTEMCYEGVLYRLVECDNVEIFADHNLYLCVLEGKQFYDTEAYLYDENKNIISRNESYEGLNALFRLPVSREKADPAKASDYMAALGIREKEFSGEKRAVTLDESFTVEGGNEMGAQAAEYALQFVGNPYVWGGDSLTEGADCSGFVKAVFENFGMTLPHSAERQKECGVPVEGLENARPGDLLFYEEPSHVAVYIGEGMIVHADPRYDICVSDAEYDEIVAVRRIFTEE